MKKKGFTLVELLAVIVILAIIAIIATPMILNVIDNAKKGASESSALGYIEGIEKYIVLNEVTKEKDFSFEKGLGYNVKDIKDYIEIKGDKPTEGWICIGDKKEVTKAKLKINNYVIKYENNKATVVDEEIGNMKCSTGPTQEVATNGETYKAIVYLDPTDLTKKCNASNSVSTTGTKEGCMKWYAYVDDGTNYTMILDHNTTAIVKLSTGIDNVDAMNEIKKVFINDILTWDSNLNAKLITADEIATIIGRTTFNSASSSTSIYLDDSYSASNGQAASKYAWLYDYTNDCRSHGCNIDDSSTYGYWTSTPIFNSTTNIWSVDYWGMLYKGIVNYSCLARENGVRPVITITKDKIS